MSYRSTLSISQLIGATIINAGYFDDDDLKSIPTLIIRLPNGIVKTFVMMADAEGNAAGWVDIYDMHLVSDVIRKKP